jgi:hypothetical protein
MVKGKWKNREPGAWQGLPQLNRQCEEPYGVIIYPEQKEEELGGKVKTRWREWRTVEMRREVWRIVKEGIWLKWVEEAPEFEIQNRRMTEEEEKVVTEEIKNLKKQRVLRVVEEERGQCVSPLSIGEREGEKRAVVDFKKMNEYIVERKFKQETFKEVRKVVREGDWMVKIDFKRAFHAIAVKENFRKFLRIQWKGELLEFQSMPLGLAVSPAYFHTVMEAMAQHLRRKGVTLLYSVDDWVIVGRTKGEAEEKAQNAIEEIDRLGLTINRKKSIREAVQKVIYLGIEIDTKRNKVRIPVEKVKNLRKAVRKMMKEEEASARDVKRIIGKMAWAVEVWRWLKRELTRLHWVWKEKVKRGWDKKEKVGERLKRILVAILKVPTGEKEREIDLVRRNIMTTIVTDAGPRAGAAVVTKGEWRKVWIWKWTKEERMKSTNWRELKVMERVMEKLRGIVKEEEILWMTDSKVASSYVRRVIGKEKKLAKMSWRVRRIEMEKGVTITVKAVKGEFIKEVDKLSRVVDDQDYQL